MKKLAYPLLAMLTVLAIASCKKAAVKASENGCISQIPYTSLSQADSATVAGLMKSNNLSTANQDFYFYETYNTGTGEQNNPIVDVQIVTATQVTNGLPIFFYDLNYAFDNGVLNSPVTFRPGNITLDNKPTLDLQKLRDSFLAQDKGMEYNPAVAVGMKDSCLVAQFGYYDLNVDFPNNGPSFIKVWYVRPKNSKWPHGYFRDDTGAAIFFSPLTSSGETP